MRIIEKNPPNYKQIARTFDLSGKKVVFTYGDILYNPGKYHIPPDLMVHEEVHAKQQGSGPHKWWERYLIDSVFRVLQETEAYRAQYQFVNSMPIPKRVVRNFLTQLAMDLSGPMYGNLMSCAEAEIKIKG